MPTYSIKGPDGKTYSIDGPPGATQEQVIAQIQAMQQAKPAEPQQQYGNPQGDQPGIIDRAVASPAGRFVHDVGVKGVEGIARTVSMSHPLLTGMKRGLDTVFGAIEKPYQGALDRNRNTPGYQAERQRAEAMLKAAGGSGLTDQLMAPFQPTVAGLVGGLFGGSLDAANAQADASAAGIEGFRERHPVLSFGANLAGGLAMGGPAGMQSVPANLKAYALPRTPERAGADYVQRLMKSSGVDETTLRNAPIGKPITSAEAIGKPAEVALGALARREGQTADAFGGLALARNSSAPRRIADDYAVASGINPAAARGDIEAFIESTQKAANPLYAEAYKANQNIASPLLDRILETPAGKQALTSARVKMQNDMSLMGTPDADLMAQAVEGGTAIPKRGVASGMKLRVYDYVKRSLDDQIEAAYKAGNKNEANIIKDLKGRLVSELDKADVTAAAGPNSLKPEGGLYAQARAKAGEYLGAKKQFDLAQSQILDEKFTAKDFADHISKLSEADRQAYLGGAANKLFNLQQTGKLKATIFKTPIVQEKLAAAMGRDKAREFIQNMESEARMAEFVRKRAPGAGSPTQEYAAAMVDQDGAASLGMDAIQVGNDAVRQGITPAIANLVLNKGKNMAANYLTRGMATPVRDAAGQLLMLPPSELAAQLSRLRPIPQPPLMALPTPSQQIPLGLIGTGMFGRNLVPAQQ